MKAVLEIQWVDGKAEDKHNDGRALPSRLYGR